MRRTLFLSFILAVAACAPSPLYVSRNVVGTAGEVPRDGRGEPIFDAIRPVPGTDAVQPAKRRHQPHRRRDD